ncbi:GAF and ANTAR domain-containing protein [Actinoplanes sp. NEAU-A12]|uniref:GAF and ANTAR domain-containing protein n=1 Tax=Actinoplanes sandaracinus TaxID=3045177 RepID=A0ABT6WWL4_9ACTN|nr:GAF and ANTAR domain-containing protein [Actinoplanes sandaracinus]MDI6104139.1 GAF and ANTAR domain-containing protein [Actinoplanes sandaracinus]
MVGLAWRGVAGSVGAGRRVAAVGDRVDMIRNLIEDQPFPPGGGVGLLFRVCTAATHTLAASGAGISMMTETGARGVYAASDPLTERIEELQFVLGEGPCWDAFSLRRPVLVPDLGGVSPARWPMYIPAVQDSGIRAVFSFPLQLGAVRLGVLDVFRRRAGSLTGDELADALVFAEVTMTALLDHHEQATTTGFGDGLADAGEHRAELFQAQGMVMVQLGVSIGEAMARMRAYAFAHGRHLDDVARDVVARRLHFDRDRP